MPAIPTLEKKMHNPTEKLFHTQPWSKKRKEKEKGKQKKVSCMHLHVFVCRIINIPQSSFACYLPPAIHSKAEALRDGPQRSVFTQVFKKNLSAMYDKCYFKKFISLL